MDAANNESYNDQLADKISLLAGQINAANYRFLTLIAEFDQLKAWAGYGFRSCAHWLNWKCGLSFGTAREKVRVARAMEGLLGINTAFSAGELRYSKVRAMTRVATDLNEEYLLMIAQYGTAQHVEMVVKAFRTVVNTDCCGDGSDLARDRLKEEFDAELTEQNKQDEERSLSCYQDDDGMWVIHAKLPAEEGGLVVKLINALGDQIAINHKDNSLDNSLSNMAEAKEKDVPTVILDNGLTFPQRRADAMVAIAQQFLAEGSLHESGASFKGSERCQLMLHVHTAINAGTSANLDGRWLPNEAAKRLACDASLVVVEEDEWGNVLNIGRRSRIIPAGMSRALSIRDGGHCQFPGCCESHFVEGHHIKHWADDGETELDNLVTLCSYHHRELHRGHFFLSLKPDVSSSRFAERLVFSRGDHDHKEGEAVIEANPCCAVHYSNELPWSLCRDIDVSTAVTRWQGERMDLGMAVEGLLVKSGFSL